jgi:hypothetical protein
MRYALHPGLVRSETDGDWHHIGFEKLRALYGLKREDCILWDSLGVWGYRWEDFVHLFPRSDGDYGTLPLRR